MTIRLRLTLLYTGLLALALVLFGAVVYGVFRWTYIQAVDSTLEGVAARVAFDWINRGRLPAAGSLLDRTTLVLVRDEDTAIAQSGMFEGFFPLPEAARQGEIAATYEVDSNGIPYRLYTLPLTINNRLRIYVQVAQTLHLLQTLTVRLGILVAAGTVVFMGLGAAGAWWVARRALAPVVNVVNAAKAVGDSADLTLRVPSPGSDDEVGQLVKTFNGMLDQLEGLYGRLAASVDAQRRFVADASHELRTPLTIIRGNIDYLQRVGQLDPEALADMASEAARMTRLVEELLTMARADAGQTPELQPVPLGPIVAEACRKATALPHEAEFQAELPEALDRITVLGNPEWLARILLILIDNAFKYTPKGKVTVRAGRQGSGVVIQVTDTGVGIAPEDLPHIFERFYRADPARSRGGTGLGLAIARWIAGLHGGTLAVESELGKGSTFSLILPPYKLKPQENS